MSLATRIAVLVACLLGVCALVAGAAFHRLARWSFESQLQGRLDARLAWLAAAVEFEQDDGELQLEAGNEPIELAEFWKVSLPDGKVLWSSGNAGDSDVIWKKRAITLGSAAAPAVQSAELLAHEGPRQASQARPPNPWQDFPIRDVPPAALAAAESAVKGFELDSARRRARLKKGQDKSDFHYLLRGRSSGREQEVRVTETGQVIRVTDRAASQYQEYAVPEMRRLELVFSAGSPAGSVERQLSRIARIFWIVGVLTIGVTGLLLVVLIRRQLRPLAQIAGHASRIGPLSINERIAPLGSAPELRQLAESINAMLARLDDALAREQRFASTAAHELRTPLAQMRTAIEVALRKPREAGEYREALQDTAADVQRLQKLVIGLLQLAHSPEDATKLVRPVSLQSIVNAARSRFPSVHLDGADASELHVYGEADLLTAAVTNVLENAARYAPAAPPQICIAASGDQVHLAISDHGPGIPESLRERIFEPFTRLDSGRGQNSEGIGLGLSIARATALAFGGDLRVTLRPDGQSGAHFIFTFRKAPAPSSDDSQN